MGTKISTTIASELTGMCADIDHMNTLHKPSTNIFLTQLHGIADPTKVTGPSTTDVMTPSPMDGLKLMLQTPLCQHPISHQEMKVHIRDPPEGSFHPQN